MNLLEKLTHLTKVVADSGDFESIKRFKTLDSTTNPSLIYAAAQNPKYNSLVDGAIEYAKLKAFDKPSQLALAIDKLMVDFGVEILKIVPGRVSTEVDARLSFNTEATISKAHELIELYKEEGIGRDRVLIKIATTWEGIKAAEILTKEGIHCNMTLLFSLPQAIACAEANVQLISPFVGRILDWFMKNDSEKQLSTKQEPGVLVVKNIYNYYKKFGYKTEIMAASFRNISEIVDLAGCDLMTISPKFLADLEEITYDLPRKLYPEDAQKMDIEKMEMYEYNFRWMMNQDAMATEKLAEGIRLFTADLIKLEELILKKL